MTATTSDSPQPSLREAIEKVPIGKHHDGEPMYLEDVTPAEAVVYYDAIIAEVESLLASAKLEKQSLEGVSDRETRLTILKYNQGAAAQYAATLQALTGREK